MIKVKTSDLIGAQLDWAVAVAEGLHPLPPSTKPHASCVVMAYPDEPSIDQGRYLYGPSHRWECGGRIIDREQIATEPHAHFVENESRGLWRAVLFYNGGEDYSADGQTALIAAMRAFVGSRLGDEVEVPEVINGN